MIFPLQKYFNDLIKITLMIIFSNHCNRLIQVQLIKNHYWINRKNIIFERNLKNMSDEPTEVCDNCLKSFPQSKIATHFGYCRRNIKKCQKCGEMYDINFTEQHEEEFHKMASCKYCKKSFKPNQLTKHEDTCTSRTQFCEYCELDVPNKDYPTHLKDCQARTKQCEKCRKPIANKDFLIHTISCEGFVEEPKPQKVQNLPSYGSYNEYVRNVQKVEQPKPQYNKPIFQEAKRQSSRGTRQFEKKHEPATIVYNNRDYKPETRNLVRDFGLQRNDPQKVAYEGSSSNNKYGVGYGEKKSITQTLSEKDKYGRGVESNLNKNIDSGKNIQSGKLIQNKNTPFSKVVQPPIADYTSGTSNGRKVEVKVPSSNINARVYQPIQNQQVLPKDNTKPTENNKKEIPSQKDVYMRREQQKPKQTQPRKQVPAQTYARPYQPTKQVPKKQQPQRFIYEDPIRQNPIRQQYKRPQYVPPQQQYVPPPRQYEQYTSQGLDIHDEDEELQKAIMASMGGMKISSSPKYQEKPKINFEDFPTDELDMMNESFYDKQRAIMEDLERNKKRR